MDDKEKEQYQEQINRNLAKQDDSTKRVGGDKFNKGQTGIIVKRGGKTYKVDKLPNK